MTAQVLLDAYYPKANNGVRYRDGTAPFYEWMLSSLPDARVKALDVGAGGAASSGWSLAGRVSHLIGVDVDPAVLHNPLLDEAYVTDGTSLPFPDNSFDCVYSDWTIEHVSRPLPFLREIHRVLKPGASYWFRTPNLHHYVTALSSMTPHWFHKLIANRARGFPVQSHEPWPTRYRMNTPGKIRSLAKRAGYSSVELRFVESYPSYLLFSAVAFRFGVAYERVVNRSDRLSKYRLIVLGRLTK